MPSLTVEADGQTEEIIHSECPEEIAYEQGLIGREELLMRARTYDKTEYGRYLLRIIGESIHGEGERLGG